MENRDDTHRSQPSSGGESRLRVAAFTGSESISSRRFRVMQYVPRLAKMGVQVDEHIARFGSWPPVSKATRPLWLIGTVLNRIAPVFRSYSHDLTLLQREFVSTFLTLERFTRRPRVLDVDDAVWLVNRRAEKNFRSLVKMCDGVICGNKFIAKHASQWNENTIVLPTGVDTERFHPIQKKPEGRAIIGWSGLNAGAKFLLGIEKMLYQVLRRRTDAVLRVVSDGRPNFLLLDDSMVEFMPWSPENEVRTIQEMSVGLMPIDETPWSSGKCSYKMLLYMACGVPVVVSPFGMNAEVLAYDKVGFGARSESEWAEAITWLLDNPSRGKGMGMTGRKVIDDNYSLNVLTPRLGAYLMSFRKQGRV